jgi:anti-anti-sigma regulatory factor
MPTRITQIENCCYKTQAMSPVGTDNHLSSSNIEGPTTVLKVEGTVHLQDAELLERICRDVAIETGRPITLDLASIDFIDSDSASVLCRMKHEQDVRLEGLHLFIQNVIELAEEADKASKYLPGSDHEVSTTS